MRIDPQRLARQHVRVLGYVRSGVHLVLLQPVEDGEQLRLDEVDENEVDGRVVRDVRCSRRDEVRDRVERERRVGRVVADAGAGLETS